MGHRVAQQHRLRLGKLTVFEHEHEFAAVGIEALNRVRDPAWEKPKIVFLHIGDKTLAVRVNCRNPRRPVKHEGPLAGGVPMQLPDASGGEPHVYARQGLGVGGGWPNGIRVLAIKRRIGGARITFASVCAYDFLQRGKASYRYRGFSDETSTSEFAHDYFS